MVLPTNPFTAKHLGVSLSPTAIRGLLLKGDTGPSLTAEHLFSTPFITGQNTDSQALKTALIALKAQLNFSGPYAAVCLPEKFAFSRQHTLPPMPINEIEEAISWQLEKIFPFPADEIYTDWKLLRNSPQELLVLVTAIPRVLLDSIKQGFETANLFPVSFEPSASALSRLTHQPQDLSAQIIMEIEGQGTASTLILNGVSVFTTTTIFTNATPSATVLDDITANVFTLLKRLPRLEDSPPPTVHIILTGEKASPALSQIIEKAVKHPTQLFALPGITPAFHLAYAAATATIHPPQDTTTINLLPTTLQAYYGANIHYHSAVLALKLVTLFMLTSLFMSLAGLLITWFNSASLTRQIATLQQTANNSQVSGVNLGTLSQQAQRFIQLFPKKTSPEQALVSILDQIPPGITLTSLSYSAPQEFTLSGVSRSRSAILKLKDNLDALQQFSKIVIPLSALENTTDYAFTLNFKSISP